MHILSIILILLVAIEFLFIMYLETIATTSDRTSKVFGIPVSQLNNKNINTLLKNQGVYNGLIGLLLIYGLFFSSAPKQLCIPILIYTIIVAVYGGLTSHISIFLKQGILPILALISLLL
ncbi:DUF1304 family protein [Staphylococcus haemolyticus]|uniref:DUF1304 domain-containing protein n=1 Tax=Staphylococcus haemolyticus TaxID=1283 RepID=UPI002901127E|nr:DUF1304 family protein [Staphylococcus haemolyticus]MDU0440194.1 DUF1304 family protein [Staphylococcus haemolyticus]MDU0445292.1 DUF1304 family protein [Staphylococcus haemolyticus]MDU0450038.1 DUF1304 family protein [Staphylococcus haemolyticus]MDU0486807.1 DUF1304 family protein [Staphylococcus haemolyticus]MDU0491455.1 DUF1304 family protein [Staphylococcus haemolyticus]